MMKVFYSVSPDSEIFLGASSLKPLTITYKTESLTNNKEGQRQ